jgi:hypothetical protein
MHLIERTLGGAATATLQRAARTLSLVMALGLPSLAVAQAPFPTAAAATDALIDAIATNDTAALPRILGKDWRRMLPAGGVDIDDVYRFLAKAHESRRVEVNGSRGFLVIGNDPWTLPIPILQASDGQWRFDPVGARGAIAERRIGRNERRAINAALAYVDAQRDYAAADRNGDGVLEYAQKLLSGPGRRDGLIWSASLGDESPLGTAYVPADARQAHGYRYRIVTAQGPAASGGARNYVIGKRMTAGFALIAWPERFGETGVMTFIVSNDGKVFERNLGPRTHQAAADIRTFNPDDAWKPAKP